MKIENYGIIYSALIVTFALIWNIASYLYNKLSKLSIVAYLENTTVIFWDKQTMLPPNLIIKATNTGEKIIYIDRPFITFKKNKKENKYFQLMKKSNDKIYPLEIHPDHIYEESVSLLDLNWEFKKRKNSDFYITIQSTLQKKYRSNTIRHKEIIQNIKNYENSKNNNKNTV